MQLVLLSNSDKNKIILETSRKQRRSLETATKELQARLDEAEANVLKGGKRLIQKLETRVRKKIFCTVCILEEQFIALM